MNKMLSGIGVVGQNLLVNGKPEEGAKKVLILREFIPQKGLSGKTYRFFLHYRLWELYGQTDKK
jgi:hypothetical protein